jgi:hypothetical protein
MAQQITPLHPAAATPTQLVNHLHQRLGVGRRVLDGLCWGQIGDLPHRDCDRIAQELALDASLLRCLLTPTSPEVCAETLLRVGERLPVTECVQCAALHADAIEAAERPCGADELTELVVDVMAHQRAHPNDAAPERSAADLSVMFRSLPRDAQERILAYARHELSVQSGV